MLSKKYRLNRRQVQIVLKRGRGRNFSGIGVKTLPNNLSYSRFAVVVPKVVSKKATERNRLRRIIYDEISKNQSTVSLRASAKQTIIQEKDCHAPTGGARNDSNNRDMIIRLFKPPADEKILRSRIREIFSA